MAQPPIRPNFALYASNGSRNIKPSASGQQETFTNAGTITQSASTTIAGSSTAFTPQLLVGGTIYNTPGGGPFNQHLITGYTSSSSITVSISNTITAGSSYVASLSIEQQHGCGAAALAVAQS